MTQRVQTYTKIKRSILEKISIIKKIRNRKFNTTFVYYNILKIKKWI